MTDYLFQGNMLTSQLLELVEGSGIDLGLELVGTRVGICGVYGLRLLGRKLVLDYQRLVVDLLNVLSEVNRILDLRDIIDHGRCSNQNWRSSPLLRIVVLNNLSFVDLRSPWSYTSLVQTRTLQLRRSRS